MKKSSITFSTKPSKDTNEYELVFRIKFGLKCVKRTTAPELFKKVITKSNRNMARDF